VDGFVQAGEQEPVTNVCPDGKVSLTTTLVAGIVPVLRVTITYVTWSPGLAVMLVLVQLPEPAGQTNLLTESVVVVGVGVTVVDVVFDVPVVVVPVAVGPFACA
jgi:hypothetical protein